MRYTRILFAVFALSASAIGVACVLADPPPTVGVAGLERPLILNPAVSPPLGQKLTMPPTNTPLVFNVPVQVDPNQQLQYRVFLDLTTDPKPQKLTSMTDDGGATGTLPDSGDVVRVLTFEIAASSGIDFSMCHQFTFIVAGNDFLDPSSPTPNDPPGGDQVTWFYQPIPDCTYYDAAPPTYDPNDGSSE